MNHSILRFFRPALFFTLVALAVALSGCAYITGEAITVPVSSPVTKDALKTSVSPPRWVWGGGDLGYATVVDRQTHQKIRDVTAYEAFGIVGVSSSLTNPVIIDVRTPEEFASGYIWRYTLNIDFNSPNFREDIAKLDKNKTYIIYCQSGIRSAAARDVFEKLGFQGAINVIGGMNAWLAAGLPVVK